MARSYESEKNDGPPPFVLTLTGASTLSFPAELAHLHLTVLSSPHPQRTSATSEALQLSASLERTLQPFLLTPITPSSPPPEHITGARGGAIISKSPVSHFVAPGDTKFTVTSSSSPRQFRAKIDLSITFYPSPSPSPVSPLPPSQDHDQAQGQGQGQRAGDFSQLGALIEAVSREIGDKVEIGPIAWRLTDRGRAAAETKARRSAARDAHDKAWDYCEELPGGWVGVRAVKLKERGNGVETKEGETRIDAGVLREYYGGNNGSGSGSGREGGEKKYGERERKEKGRGGSGVLGKMFPSELPSFTVGSVSAASSTNDSADVRKEAGMKAEAGSERSGSVKGEVQRDSGSEGVVAAMFGGKDQEVRVSLEVEVVFHAE